MRIYAVGDIHGRLDLLIRLQEKIQADAARSRARSTDERFEDPIFRSAR